MSTNQRGSSFIKSLVSCVCGMMALGGFASSAVAAEEGTVMVNGVAVDFLKMTPTRGAGLSHDEILDLVRKSKPATVAVTIAPKADSK